MPRASFAFEALGTHWHIDIEDLPHALEGGLLLDRIKQRLELFEQHYSRFRPTSLISLLAKNGGTAPLPPDGHILLDHYTTAYRLTDGIVTPLIGQVLVDAGYDASYSLVPKKMTPPPRWEDVLSYSPTSITLERPAQLDFGALGKGYAIDIIDEMIADYGISSRCVEAGGDMIYHTKTTEPLRVGLEHPEDASLAIGVALVHDGHSICGSAGNRRSWGRYHHVINPKTLESPRHILAVWAIAKTTVLADMFTSCLFFVPPQKLLTRFAFEYVIMYADHSVEHSPGFKGELFS